MKKLLLAAALACFSVPAFARDDHKAPNGTSPIASSDTKAKRTPTAKTGGLLNTGVTPTQAKRTVEETNGQIARRANPKTPR